jgi:hypothetical protein
MGKITCKICGKFEEFTPETRDVTLINAGRHTQKEHPDAAEPTVVVYPQAATSRVHGLQAHPERNGC